MSILRITTKNDAIPLYVTPAVSAVVPAVGGYILATTHDPVIALLMLMAIAISGLVHHLMALDWREARMTTSAVCTVLRQRDEEEAKRDAPKP